MSDWLLIGVGCVIAAAGSGFIAGMLYGAHVVLTQKTIATSAGTIVGDPVEYRRRDAT